jgi:hypothetical protein
VSDGVAARKHDGDLDDREPGRVVRPYALTGGRTQPSGQHLDLLDMACAARRNNRDQLAALNPEHGQLLDRCQFPVPLAELAADLDLPTGIIRVLVSDLREQGLLTVVRSKPVGLGDLKILQEVVDGLRRI